jgi:hypothetical protein
MAALKPLITCGALSILKEVSLGERNNVLILIVGWSPASATHVFFSHANELLEGIGHR